MGLGIAIVSYNGEAFFRLTADSGLVPDVEDFTRHLREGRPPSSLRHGGLAGGQRGLFASGKNRKIEPWTEAHAAPGQGAS